MSSQPTVDSAAVDAKNTSETAAKCIAFVTVLASVEPSEWRSKRDLHNMAKEILDV